MKAGRAEILAAYDALNPVAFGELATRAGGAVVERDGVLLARGPEPAGVIVNGAFRRDRHTPAARVLELARDHFADGFGFTLWAPAHRDADIDQAARTAGWRMIVELPIMAIANPIAAAAPAPTSWSAMSIRDPPRTSARSPTSPGQRSGTTRRNATPTGAACTRRTSTVTAVGE